MILSDLHAADDRALQLVNALGRDEAYRKADANLGYYLAYGGADLVRQQEFWQEVKDAIRQCR